MESGVKLLMRHEQKKTACMKYILQKFTKSGNLVVDDCAGNLSAAKACVLFPNHRRPIGAKRMQAA